MQIVAPSNNYVTSKYPITDSKLISRWRKSRNVMEVCTSKAREVSKLYDKNDAVGWKSI